MLHSLLTVTVKQTDKEEGKDGTDFSCSSRARIVKRTIGEVVHVHLLTQLLRGTMSEFCEIMWQERYAGGTFHGMPHII